jgi:hypothetical protein
MAAPIEMAWEGKSVSEICRQIKDPAGALLRHQLLVDRAAQPYGNHPEGNAGRL